MSDKQEYQFEVGQWVRLRSEGLLKGTTDKVEARRTIGKTDRFAMYLVVGSWHFEDDLEPRTLDLFEQFLADRDLLDLYDRAERSGYRVRAVLPNGRIQGEYAAGNHYFSRNFPLFEGTRAEVEAFLADREQWIRDHSL